VVSLKIVTHSKKEIAKTAQVRSDGETNWREASQVNTDPKGVNTEAGVNLDLSKNMYTVVVLLNIVLSSF
jgi:hypothetical protein